MTEAAVSARLTLVSHAQTAAGRAGRFPADEPPDAQGLHRAVAVRAGWSDARRAGQAGRAGQALCDPTVRTRLTAEALGLAAACDPALADLDVGMWAGCRLADLPETEVAAWVSDPTASPHGGESVLDLLRRVEGWLAERGAAGGDVVAVTHPAVVRAVLVTALRSPPEVFWRIDVPPLTATTLHRRGGWTLRHACRPLS